MDTLIFGSTVFFYFELVYLVTVLVSPLTSYLTSSSCNSSLIIVCIFLLIIVERLLSWAKREGSVAILNKISLEKLFVILVTLVQTPFQYATLFPLASLLLLSLGNIFRLSLLFYQSFSLRKLDTGELIGKSINSKGFLSVQHFDWFCNIRASTCKRHIS